MFLLYTYYILGVPGFRFPVESLYSGFVTQLMDQTVPWGWPSDLRASEAFGCRLWGLGYIGGILG